jgi:hypothetical protein
LRRSCICGICCICCICCICNHCNRCNRCNRCNKRREDLKFATQRALRRSCNIHALSAAQ